MVPWWHDLLCLVGFIVGMIVWAGMMDAVSTASRDMRRK